MTYRAPLPFIPIPDDAGLDRDAAALKPATHVHIMGVGGTGMGTFAALLKADGYTVTGSDQGVYPPMSDRLADWGISVQTPYGAANLSPAPDLVVVGNVIRRTNPEAVALREAALPHTSFPAALGALFLSKRWPVVVSGTHGKTTTSMLLAHVLEHAGKDPGYLIGGVPQGGGEAFRVGKESTGTPFVIEGDEYDTAYFDKVPKFAHYRPKSLLATSLEFDHADIYDAIEQIAAWFEKLFALVPEDGHIVACAESTHLMAALERVRPDLACRVDTYGAGGSYTAENVGYTADGLAFDVVVRGETRGRVSVPLSGHHSVLNTLGAFAVCDGLGLSFEAIRAGLASFGGVKRRMEERGSADGVLVVDDFAHHPSAVATTLAGARARYAGRPIWALFEPRSATSCRAIFQDDYAAAFAAADRVLLAPPGRDLPPGEALDVPRLAVDVTSAGVPAAATASLDAMLETVLAEVPAGAVLMCMSNGAFGNLHQRLLDGLAARGAGPA